jgi:leucyl-tRNA synthetase
MMELVNVIYQGGADKDVLSKLVLLISPIAPHFAEELWQTLGNGGSVLKASWPVFDPAALVEDVVTMVVQCQRQGPRQVRRGAEHAGGRAARAYTRR